MHISLDSALGQQRRLNQVGESVTQIAPDPAAAYSLRSLTGSDPKVVRVRRESDNHEQDFTASEVSSGALVDFVNTQVTAPLDIQALTATGRDGDFLIAKAAYSLRSLGTRQATVAATGDTVARANGKYVCQVRRSSDDALKSFTADEITDGTLLAFTNADYVKYTSDFSAGDDGWGSLDDVTETGNIDGIGGLDNNLRLAIGSSTSQHRAFKTGILPVNQKINFSARVFIPSTNSVVDSLGIRDASGSVIIAAGTTPAQDQWVTVTASNVTTTNTSGQLRVDLQDGGTNNFAGNGSDVIYLREITVTQVTSDGFVKTWYDQSVTTQAGDTATGNHATQATAANQPKIVSAGSLLTDGINFDGSNDLLSGTTISSLASGAVFYVFKSEATNEGQLFQFSNGSTYSTSATINSGSEGRLVASSDASTDSRNGPVFGATGVTTNQKHLLSLVLDSSTEVTTATVDGSSMSSGASPTGRFDANISILSIGQRGDNSFSIQNSVSEVIIYNTDQTDNRTAIEANIGEHYSISGIPAFDNSVNGFVETWYDQSGNGNDLTQATASKQPTIVTSGTLNTRNNEPIIKFIQANSNVLQGPSTFPPTGTDFALTCFQALHIDSSSGNRLGIFGSAGGGSNAGTSKYRFGSGTSRKITVRIQDASDTVTALESSALSNDTDSILTYMIKLNDGSLELQTFNLGAQLGSTQTSSVTDQSYGYTHNTILGSRSLSDNFSDSEFFEVLFYATDQLTNRDAIEANLSNKYGISLS